MATGFQLSPEELRIIAENGSERDRAAAASGQFAQTFNQPIANQGVRAGATQVTPTTQAPPKANAAPSVNKNIATGLMEELNKQEATLVKDGIWDVANKYSIEFAPPQLGDARVTKPGKPNKARVPMQQSKNPSDQVNPDTNSADYDVRTFSFAAGTPIVVILDEILKNSTYITDQAAYMVDEITQETKPQTPLGDLVWYKISVQATPLEPFDKRRNAFAQDIKYVISAYPINSMQSEYFPTTKLRGRHKSYKYWFTGQNTQVLKFQQSFNSAYLTTFTNPDALAKNKIINNRNTPPREYQAAVSGSSSLGADGLTNSIGASAADYLYNRADIASCELNIVGDPAWLQQGEIATGVSSLNFNFNPFNPDGGINYDSQEIVFDLQWNPGVDYDLTGTGLANPNKSSTPKAVYTYKAAEVVSRFSKGKFEQDIHGVEFDLLEAKTVAAETNDRAPAVSTPAVSTPAKPREPAVPRFADTLRSSVTNPAPSSVLAKGVQQILTPVTNGDNLSDSTLRSTPIYNQVRRTGAGDAAALAAARAASSAGTNNYSGSALPGVRVPNQLIVKDQ